MYGMSRLLGVISWDDREINMQPFIPISFMKKLYILTAFVLACLSGVSAQNILDFESLGTTTNFEYFGMGTLNGTTTSNIPNPDASGINTSATVLEFTKEGTAYVWGGGFSNPNPTNPVDLVTNNQLCVKVWMDHIGNVGLKLENSLTGDNWIRTAPNTLVNQWEEICFDVSLPSIEAPFTGADGHEYPTVVMFMDFGTAGTGTNVVSYLDDFVANTGGGPTPANVTLSVDLNEYSGTITDVNVAGNFNSWCTTCDVLTDPDSDGVYSGTVSMTTGAEQYKFLVNGTYEEIGKFEECAALDGAFANREVLIAGDVTLDPVCWESCYACGDAVSISIELGFEDAITPADSVYLAGGGVFEDPGGRYKLEDTNADGIYEISFTRNRGWESYFAFANGACPDYSCKEDLNGLPCAFADNFNDRRMGPIMNDTTITTCFATCSDSATCGSGTPPNGLFTPERGLTFELYPSVTSNVTTLVLQEAGEATIEVYSLQGTLMLAEQINGTRTHAIEVRHWAPAMYVIKVLQDGTVGTRTFIVE